MEFSNAIITEQKAQAKYRWNTVGLVLFIIVGSAIVLGSTAAIAIGVIATLVAIVHNRQMDKVFGDRLIAIAFRYQVQNLYVWSISPDDKEVIKRWRNAMKLLADNQNQQKVTVYAHLFACPHYYVGTVDKNGNWKEETKADESYVEGESFEDFETRCRVFRLFDMQKRKTQLMSAGIDFNATFVYGQDQ